MAERIPRRYALGGFTLHAECALPMLPRALEDDGLLGRIEVAHGAVPSTIEGVALVPGVTVSARELLLDVPAIGRLWIRDGRRIIAAAASGGNEADVRPFILGSGIGAICHQRGLTPLHGSAVVANARAHVFLGPQGMGKSTMMASLLRAGFAPLADDLTIVDISPDAGPRAFPGVPRIKLWPDMAEFLGFGGNAASREISSATKLQIPFASAGARAPVELGGLYLLEDAAALSVERLSADLATELLLPQIYRRMWLLPGRPTLERVVALRRIATAIPVYRLARPRTLDLLPRLVAMVRECALRHPDIRH